MTRLGCRRGRAAYIEDPFDAMKRLQRKERERREAVNAAMNRRVPRPACRRGPMGRAGGPYPADGSGGRAGDYTGREVIAAAC